MEKEPYHKHKVKGRALVSEESHRTGAYEPTALLKAGKPVEVSPSFVTLADFPPSFSKAFATANSASLAGAGIFGSPERERTSRTETPTLETSTLAPLFSFSE